MKKDYYFAAVAIIIIIFSITAVAANENITDEVTSPKQNSVILDEDQNSPNEDTTDLSVEVEVNNVYVGNKYNTAGSEVPWNVTARVSHGTAYNAKVKITLNGNFEYSSHNARDGQFDSQTLIWDIGDLDNSTSAFLSIVTKIKVNGTFRLTAQATSDSNDIDLSNNEEMVPIKTGVSKFGSNETETTADKSENDHNNHYASSANVGIADRVIQNNQSTSAHTNKKSSNSKGESHDNSNSNSENKNETTGSVASYSKSTLKVFDIEKVLSNPLSDEESNLSENPLKKWVSPFLYTQDYKSIPTGIFALFLVLLMAIVGYDKIKS